MNCLVRISDTSNTLITDQSDATFTIDYSYPSIIEKKIVFQNYPNPFNPITSITYTIPSGLSAPVTLKIYDIRGTLVRTLVNDVKGEGIYTVEWNATDNYGSRVSCGVYLCRITAGELDQTRKMILMK
jgi:hypothetical protein